MRTNASTSDHRYVRSDQAPLAQTITLPAACFFNSSSLSTPGSAPDASPFQNARRKRRCSMGSE